MKKSVVGILAHVDAGKTTLSESMLYLSGSIRKQGRVDHGDSFLDYDHLERQRGITIFSSLAKLSWKDLRITLVDTPGHLDFSSEMERTLSILDYAIVVLNGREGIQSHSETIWNLLRYYSVPTFIFVNKMDIAESSQEDIMKLLVERFNEHCIDFSHEDNDFYENISLTSDELLEDYLTNGMISKEKIRKEIQNRNIFPCFFGSALKNRGVKEFLDILESYIDEKKYPEDFRAKVYKINRDKNDQLTFIKVTGGTLKVKTVLENGEKVDGIRSYSGNKYELLQEGEAGDLCALTGIHHLKAGDVLGKEKMLTTQLSSYMNYHIVLSPYCDKHKMIENLKQLELEEPQLHLSFVHNEIHVSLMGEIQIEVLKNMIKERFDEDVEFDQGQVQYKETILETIEGVGHYEPLRHYSEVHILLEPLKEGNGLQFATQCKEDELERHWQRLILTHMQEKDHLGVLIGAPITDIKLTLVSGKAHLKHTEGGDFRQAVYRAIRQGLKLTRSAILEPYYQFRLEIPIEYLSRAIYNIEEMNGKFQIESEGEMTVISGEAPIASMQNYQREVVSYTKGLGRLYCRYIGYKRCQNEEEVIQKFHYDSESDLENPTGSVFCSHGAGFNVHYDEVYQYMHLPLKYKKPEKKKNTFSKTKVLAEQLDEIFIRTYGPIKHRNVVETQEKKTIQAEMKEQKHKCLLVDGYNVIFQSQQLSEIAFQNLDVARERLIDMLSNYQGYQQCILILVFDAYKVKGSVGSIEKYHNIYIVYTKEAQTADAYIERTTHQMAKDYNIIVATSDAMEQMIVIGGGATRISSRQLLLEIESISKEKLKDFQDKQDVSRNYLLEDINILMKEKKNDE